MCLFQCISYQVAGARKEEVIKDTSEEYVEEITEDLLKWQVAANKGTLRCEACDLKCYLAFVGVVLCVLCSTRQKTMETAVR